jgi:hypothetical protein
MQNWALSKKKHSQIDAVYTLPVTISATRFTLHILYDVLKQLDSSDMLYVTIKRSVIINAHNVFRKFLFDNTLQQSVINIFTFTLIIQRVRWCDYRVEQELMRGGVTTVCNRSWWEAVWLPCATGVNERRRDYRVQQGLMRGGVTTVCNRS